MSLSVLEWLRLSAVALLVLLVPGWAWMSFPSGRRHDFFEGLADAIGISAALSALLAQAGFFLHFSVLPVPVFVFWILAGCAIFVGLFLRLRRGFPRLNGRMVLFFMGGLLALGGVLAWRMVQARDLALPPWVDPVHHVLIVDKILAFGSLPQTLAPEMSIPFAYHYGFHILAALFAFAAKMDTVQSVLWLGQVINALVALSVYRLVKSAWQDTRKAALAGLLVGFAFHMPAYYLTWGRYTLLTGLVLLPLAMAAGLEVIREPHRREAWLRLAVLTAGVSLCHLLTMFLLALFFAICLLAEGIPALLRWRRKEKIAFPWQAFVFALIGVGLAAPWLGRIWSELHRLSGVQVILPQANESLKDTLSYIVYLLGPKRNYVLLILAAMGLWWGLFRRETRRLAVWGLVMVLLALPWGLHMDPFRPDQVAIVIFLPATLFLADFLVEVGKLRLPVPTVHGAVEGEDVPRPRWIRRAEYLKWMIVLVGAVYLLNWGLRETRSIVNQVTILADDADLRAAQWIRGHTPEDAVFFINTAYWQTNAWRGVDGGYWLPALAARRTLIPPALYGFGDSEEVMQINQWAETASQLTTCDQAFQTLTAEAGITHLYLTAGKGSLQASAAADCPNWVLLYQQDGRSIYSLENP